MSCERQSSVWTNRVCTLNWLRLAQMSQAAQLHKIQINTNDILYYIANILQIAGGHPICPNEFLSQDQYRNFPRETRNSVQRSRLTGMATGRKILNFEIVCRNTMKDRGKPVCSAEIWNKTGQSQSLAVNAGEAWHPFPQHTCCLKALWGLFISSSWQKYLPNMISRNCFFCWKYSEYLEYSKHGMGRTLEN